MISIGRSRPLVRSRFAEMAVWHEWPDSEEALARRPLRVNIPAAERWVSLMAGAALAAWGISRRSLGGTLAAIGGGAMMMRGVSGFCPLYHALGMNEARRGRAEPVDYLERGIQAAQTIAIDSPPESLYEFWRDFTNLPRIMRHLQSVEVLDDTRSHWVARGPLGASIEWDAQIINEEPNELIAWRSLPGSEIDIAGSVRFERRGEGGTTVHVTLDYIPAAGRLGAAIARIFGREPNQQIRDDLQRFKQFAEAGEWPTLGG